MTSHEAKAKEMLEAVIDRIDERTCESVLLVYFCSAHDCTGHSIMAGNQGFIDKTLACVKKIVASVEARGGRPLDDVVQ